MFAVDEGLRSVNGVEMTTFQRGAMERNTWLDVEAGTTGYSGSGCRDAGGRTFLRIEGMSGDFFFKPILDKEKKCKGIIIAGCGDDALDAIVKGLEFGRNVLDDQRCEIND